MTHIHLSINIIKTLVFQLSSKQFCFYCLKEDAIIVSERVKFKSTQS